MLNGCWSLCQEFMNKRFPIPFLSRPAKVAEGSMRQQSGNNKVFIRLAGIVFVRGFAIFIVKHNILLHIFQVPFYALHFVSLGLCYDIRCWFIWKVFKKGLGSCMDFYMNYYFRNKLFQSKYLNYILLSITNTKSLLHPCLELIEKKYLFFLHSSACYLISPFPYSLQTKHQL